MWTAIGIFAILVLYFIALYNGFVAQQNQMRSARTIIESLVNRRDKSSDADAELESAVQFYNKIVTEYNNQLVQFPNNIVARIFGFAPEQSFKIKKES